jgi:A/G-specific adenine glycosylase
VALVTGIPRRSELPSALGTELVRWFRAHSRPLPWRVDRDPYHVWVAEILLQQTRVAQARPYYERFLRAFPNVETLAAAPLEDVMKVWQGAGYYARARHLHEAARVVVSRHHGALPQNVDELEALPGVGPYVARAIASLAFGAPVVALEANGLRVAARWTRTEGDVRAPAVRRFLEAGLVAAMPKNAPEEFNEALMELGETVCVPASPRCDRCPVTAYCRAFRELEDPGVLPVRSARKPRPHVRAAVVALSDGERWFVQRRAPSGLLGGLWEFPGGKVESGERPVDAAERELAEETGFRTGPLEFQGIVEHGYSHFTVELHVFAGSLAKPSRSPLGPERRWVTPSELRRLPLPRATEKVVELLEKLTLSR